MRVVVVGSGVSALTAAAILAKNGRQVLLIERQPEFGGALRQFKRKKIAFDVGFHYTGCAGSGEILDLIWSYCAIRPRLRVLPLGSEGHDRFEFTDRTPAVRGYFSYPRLAEELRQHFPAERAGIDTYLAAVRQICADVPFYHPEQPLLPFLRGYKNRPTSLAEFLVRHIGDRYLRAVLAAPGFLYGVPQSQASLEVHALVAHGYYSGAYTLDGGGQSLVDAFLAVLAASGVEMRSGESVEQVLVEGEKVVGVELAGGERVAADQVIYTGHPATLMGRVPASLFRPAYWHRLAGLANSLSLFAVFAEGERELDIHQGPLNYYLLPGSGDILSADPETPRQRRPMMMTGTRTAADELLHQGRNGIILLGLGYWQEVRQFEQSSSGRRPPGYEHYKARVAEEMIGVAEKRWGAVSGTIRPLAVGTPLTFRDELGAPEGCAYGAMHCLGQYNPEVRTRLPGLFLAGQSTVMTGVAGASISGLIAAGEILGLEQLWQDVVRCR